MRFSFGDVPTRRLELRTLLRADLRPRGAPSLVTETACGAVPVYGPLLRAIQLCNDDDVLVTSGTATTRPSPRPRGRARRRASGSPAPTCAGPRPRRRARSPPSLAGTPLPAARHVVAILLTDAGTGAPVDLDLASLTTVATDPPAA